MDCLTIMAHLPRVIPKTFLAYPNFPGEVKIKIWTEFFLDPDQVRIVVMDQSTREIIPSKPLASSKYTLDSSSWAAFKSIYPVRVPVYHNYSKAKFLDEDSNGNVENAANQSANTGTDDEEIGFIRLGFDHDIFLVKGMKRSIYGLDGWDEKWVVAAKSKTHPLSLEHCKLMRNLSKSIRKIYPM